MMELFHRSNRKGFAEDGVTPVYHELYPNALQEISEGKEGWRKE